MRVTYPHLPRLLKVARTVGGMKPRVNVVWHKMSDLRVHDHEPLARAHLETRASAEPCSSSNALATGVINIDLSWGKTVRFLGGMNILWLNLLQFGLGGWGVVSVEAYFYGGRYCNYCNSCNSPPKFDFIVAQQVWQYHGLSLLAKHRQSFPQPESSFPSFLYLFLQTSGLPVVHLRVVEKFWFGRTRVGGFRKTGAVRCRFWMESVEDLKNSLEARGQRLFLRCGSWNRWTWPKIGFEHLSLSIWGFPQMGVPRNGWFIRENPFKMDDLRVPPFMDPPI